MDFCHPASSELLVLYNASAHSSLGRISYIPIQKTPEVSNTIIKFFIQSLADAVTLPVLTKLLDSSLPLRDV